MGNLLQQWLYGDLSQEDLKRTDFKENRLRQFTEILKIRWRGLIILNLLQSLFVLPLFFGLGTAIGWLKGEAEALPPEILLLLTAAGIFAFAGSAGALQVIGIWAEDTHAWIWKEFWRGMVLHGKRNMPIVLFNGVVLWIFMNNYGFYRMQPDSGALHAAGYYMTWILLIAAVLMNLYLLPLAVARHPRIRVLFKNSFYMMLAELPRAAGMLVILLIWALLMALLTTLFLIPVLFAGFAFPMVLISVYTDWVFERYLGKAS